MRIILDLQGAQNGSRFRGIGRYSLSLARQMIVTAQERHEFHVLLNRNLPEGLPDAAAAFDRLLPRSQLHIVDLPGPSAEVLPENLWRTRAAELVREAALHELGADLVHIASLFEGYGDNCVSSIGALGLPMPTAVTIYDMIPLLWPDDYLGSAQARRWYYRKAQFARRADLLLAISASSAAEGQSALHCPLGQMVTIGTGVDEKFRPVPVDAAEEARLRRQYRLEKPFVMCAGAADPRKNLHGLVQAFARLAAPVRARHCLAIVGRMNPDDAPRILDQAAAAGLAAHDVVFTGFIPDEDLVRIYSLCAALVFPSFHEGFGLPAAEAMACGAPVIGSDRTSIPEVIGRSDALFDPADPASIAERLTRVLVDPDFSHDLRRHGPIQASRFTWTGVAERSIAAFERLHEERQPARAVTMAELHLIPRVAFVSPLPPRREGSARHASRLLPCLSLACDVTCIDEQPCTTDTWLDATLPIRPRAWLRKHAGKFDHVLYNLTRETATPALLEMMRDHPGCVLLHDTGLSCMLATVGADDAMQLLYAEHGWRALLFARREGIEEATRRFDCLLPFLAEAETVITHSPALDRHVRDRLGDGGPKSVCIPPPPGSRAPPARLDARTRLGLEPDGFVVCNLVLGGVTGGIGQQREALDGWLSRIDPGAADMMLVAVGWAPPDIEAAVADDVGRFGSNRVRLVRECAALADLLAASDLLLHLGCLTGADAAALAPDLSRAGVPVLAGDAALWNMLPPAGVASLPPEPDAVTIARALDELRADPPGRARMAAAIRDFGANLPAPDAVGARLRAALDACLASRSGCAARALRSRLEELPPADTPADRGMAEAAARSNRRRVGPARLFIDVSVLSIHDARSGIQRVSRSILAELMAHPPPGHRVEPIRWSAGIYRHAREYARNLFGLDFAAPPDEPVHGEAGDVYLSLDLIMATITEARPWFEAQRLRGMRTVFIVYDLLPTQRPAMFPPAIGPIYRNWISNVLELADGVIGISRAVMQELAGWIREHPPQRPEPLQLGWFHLGNNIEASLPSAGISSDADLIRRVFLRRETFLSVGTLEPRKGYSQALAAFETLWASGVDVNYAIVGGRGWMDDAFFRRLEAHPEYRLRLFWFHDVSDELLAQIYRQATVLLAVSEAEGFGLPLVEAAKFGLPIVCRDIPAFREIADGHASFFDTLSGPELGAHLAAWLSRYAAYDAPGSAEMPLCSWQASAQRLVDVAIGGHWSVSWEPSRPCEGLSLLGLPPWENPGNGPTKA